jgi:hypothetical protein
MFKDISLSKGFFGLGAYVFNMISPGEVFGYDDTQVRDVCHTFRGLVVQMVLEWSRGEDFFRDMCNTLHLDGLNVMPQSLLQILSSIKGPIATDGEISSRLKMIV